jgi:S-adenosylmethionine:tRNA ribosyltransferase-isomerase
MGSKIRNLKSENRKEISIEEITVQQWNAYELNDENISAQQSLNALLNWMKENNHTKLIAKTQILIAPPYKLKVADALITNFHQPKSTLLLLVAAIVGDKWKSIYDYALQNNFRFLSYGDACLLMP